MPFVDVMVMGEHAGYGQQTTSVATNGGPVNGATNAQHGARTGGTGLSREPQHQQNAAKHDPPQPAARQTNGVSNGATQKQQYTSPKDASPKNKDTAHKFKTKRTRRLFTPLSVPQPKGATPVKFHAFVSANHKASPLESVKPRAEQSAGSSPPTRPTHRASDAIGLSSPKLSEQRLANSQSPSSRPSSNLPNGSSGENPNTMLLSTASPVEIKRDKAFGSSTGSQNGSMLPKNNVASYASYLNKPFVTYNSPPPTAVPKSPPVNGSHPTQENGSSNTNSTTCHHPHDVKSQNLALKPQAGSRPLSHQKKDDTRSSQSPLTSENTTPTSSRAPRFPWDSPSSRTTLGKRKLDSLTADDEPAHPPKNPSSPAKSTPPPTKPVIANMKSTSPKSSQSKSSTPKPSSLKPIITSTNHIVINGTTPKVSTVKDNRPSPLTNGHTLSPRDSIVVVDESSTSSSPSLPPTLPNGVSHDSPPTVKITQRTTIQRAVIPKRPRFDSNTFDSNAFDAQIYAQSGTLDPPAGIQISEDADTEHKEERLYLQRNPLIHGMHDRSEKWYQKKLKERNPGGRKFWFGKVVERQRWLNSQRLKVPTSGRSTPSSQISRRNDPEPWSHQRPVDFGDVSEDNLPSYVKENPAWVNFCGRLRNEKVRISRLDAGLQREERAKRRQQEIDKLSLTNKEAAQKQLATEFLRQTEEFYNSVKKA